MLDVPLNVPLTIRYGDLGAIAIEFVPRAD
jgi:hypothetical protein